MGNVRIEKDNRGQWKRFYANNADMLVGKAAHDCEAMAKANAPVDTGFLRNSIQAVKISNGIWQVNVGAAYGFFVEFGTRRSGAQPFLYPAFLKAAAALNQALRRR
jgi:HK97 gp10 family phage protein